MHLTVIGMAKSMMGFELHPMESQNLIQNFTTVKDTLQGSLKSIRESEEKTKILDEWKYFMKHMDRRRGFVFARVFVMTMHVTAIGIKSDH